MTKIFFVSHDRQITGAANYFKLFLQRKGFTLIELSHPLDDYHHGETKLIYNRAVRLIINRRKLGFLNLLIDLIISFWQIRQYNFATFIGANNFDTFPAIVCRQFLGKRIRKIIYFASDFSENRYQNKLLNLLYLKLESYVLQHADLVVSNTFRAEKRRFALGLQPGKSLVVINGVYLDSPGFKPKNIKRSHFIYVGSVNQEHGLYEFLKTAYPLVEKVVIIGSGEDLDKVIALCQSRRLHYKHYKQMTHQQVIRYLQKFEGMGLAPYNHHSQYIYYGSSLKINEYIACGLPVITSYATEMGEFIEKKDLGITYSSLSYHEIAEKIERFNTMNFFQRSQEFYTSHNSDSLYRNIHI